MIVLHVHMHVYQKNGKSRFLVLAFIGSLSVSFYKIDFDSKIEIKDKNLNYRKTTSRNFRKKAKVWTKI